MKKKLENGIEKQQYLLLTNTVVSRSTARICFFDKCYLWGIFFCLLSHYTIFAQTISGKFTTLANQEITLEGFSGLRTYTIATTKADEKGNFKLHYSKLDYGMGYLKSGDGAPLLVILSTEAIEFRGETLANTTTLKTIKSNENQWFAQYAQEHLRRDQAVSAWDYLEKIYTKDSLFLAQSLALKGIQTEKQRIKAADTAFLESLPKTSYASWFLPTRKLVSSVGVVAQYRTEEIPATIAAFRAMDYTDTRLYKSGLFKEAIDNHFWLLENSGQSQDKIVAAMKTSIDSLLIQLSKNEKLFNEVTQYLFELLERHSLFQASEYLAVKVLYQGSCQLNDDLARELETYRAMKKGNTAADIVFDASYFANSTQTIKSLSSLKSAYTVVVFGASWCPKCQTELPELVKRYASWKSNGVEVVFVALEDDKKAFTAFASSFPFPSYSDLKKWDSTIVSDYYVFSTPTLFLLDSQRKIILRPSSIQQLDAWIDWFLIQGKK